MLNTAVPALAALACGAATLAGTPWLIGFLRRRGVMDVPGPRSNHVAAVPRGGGLAIVVPLAVAWAGLCMTLSGPEAISVWAVWAGFVLLAAVSWLDDMRPQPVGLRLLAQAFAVGLALALLPARYQLLPAMPLPLERLLLALCWVWFINAINFMDGLDGLASGQAMTASSGFFVIAATAPVALAQVSGAIALALAASSLAFLVYNWPPARVFLGDSGSIPVGFCLGWLMLLLAVSGYPLAAMILPMYFMADATLTLVARLARGENVTRPHSSHFYQRARRAGKSHTWVTSRATVANVLLAVCAAVSPSAPLFCTLAAFAVTASLIVTFALAHAKVPGKTNLP